MSVYRHATADWREILIEDGSDGRVFAKITDQRASGYHSITLPADERRKAAQAVAGADYRVVLISEYELSTDRPLEQAHEDLRAILAALGLGDHARPYSPHECVQRDVLPAIQLLQRDVDRLHSENTNLAGQITELREQPDRPEPVDPSEIAAGDRVEVVITGTVQGVGGGAVDLISDDSTGIGIIDNYSETTWRVLQPTEVDAMSRVIREALLTDPDTTEDSLDTDDIRDLAHRLIRSGKVQVVSGDA